MKSLPLTVLLLLAAIGVLRAALPHAVAEQPSVADTVGQPSVALLWDEGNTAYLNGDYRRAAEAYEAIERQGLSSAKLYYNLANVYFREERLGPSILYYHKALRLAPADEDIRYNLEVARSRTKDHIEAVPEFFLRTWMRSLSRTFSGNQWAAASLVLFALFLAGLVLFLLTHRLGWRKVGFYGGLAALVLGTVATSFAASMRREALHPSEAVVVRASAPVKASPEASSTDLFILHEGTPVRIRAAMGLWSEVAIADGKKGWIESRAIETVD